MLYALPIADRYSLVYIYNRHKTDKRQANKDMNYYIKQHVDQGIVKNICLILCIKYFNPTRITLFSSKLFLPKSKLNNINYSNEVPSNFHVNLIFTNRTKDKIVNVTVTYIPKKIYNITRINVVSEFLGIPFARPPTDYFRFKRPHPHFANSTGNNKFYANTPATPCTQKNLNTGIPKFDMYNTRSGHSEDCLQLNMWVPKIKTGAVIVLFHGGDLYRGSASLELYQGSFFAAYSRAIIVNVNYRLGIYGWAFLGRKTKIPGNMGLLDQNMALLWIRQHIRAFGGDPYKVTIFGHEAGAVTAATHLFAGASKNLYKRMILSSGVFPSRRYTLSHIRLFERTKEMGDLMYCKNQTSTLVEKCLGQRENTTIKRFVDYLRETEKNPLRHMFAIGNQDKEYFVREFSRLKIKKNVELMIGQTEDEGTHFFFDFVRRHFPHLSDHINTRDELMKEMNQINDLLIKKVSEEFKMSSETTNTLRNNYKYEGNKTYLVGPRLFHDMHFYCDWENFMKNILRKNVLKVYSYKFLHQPKNYKWPNWLHDVLSGSDMEYVFGLPFRNHTGYDDDTFGNELVMSVKMMKIYGRFADTGNPHDSWEPCKNGSIKSAIFNLNLAKVGYIMHEEHKDNPKCLVFK
uniref:Carboxylesterase type B domain-containing protein n=1 Tax=Strongyloides stercoralis TaxID=6248 RepID=A0AAF5D252_STRER